MASGEEKPVPGWELARRAGGLTPEQHGEPTLEKKGALGWPSTASPDEFPRAPSRSSLLYRAEREAIAALEVRAAGSGTAPQLDAPIEGSGSLASAQKSASPTMLVSIARQGPVFLLDLLAARVTQLSAADDCLLACLRDLLGEALAGRWSSPCEVLGVAHEPQVAFGELSEEAHFLALSTLEEALEEVSTRFASTDLHTTPTLVVLAEAVSAQDLERAAAGLARHQAVALIVLQAHRRARAVICWHADGRSEVYLRAEQLQVPERRLAIGASSGDQSLLASQPGSPTSTQVEINILGPIEINGATSPAQHRPKISELLVYLAMHPEGSLSRAWTAALWPDRRVPPQTVANRLSEARRLLGVASDGRPRLRRKGEHHQLFEISTDWQRFQELARQSSSPQSWREALQLVRGRPFVDLQQDQWTILEGLAIEIEQAIADCALRVGAEAISRDDPELAAWAANCALRANPFDERLHRLLMRAADASGNRAGVEESLRNLALVLEIEGDPLSGVHPQTAALYQQLLKT